MADAIVWFEEYDPPIINTGYIDAPTSAPCGIIDALHDIARTIEGKAKAATGTPFYAGWNLGREAQLSHWALEGDHAFADRFRKWLLDTENRRGDWEIFTGYVCETAMWPIKDISDLDGVEP
jgi:hypothetical protein